MNSQAISAMEQIEFEIDMITFLNMYDGMLWEDARKEAIKEFKEFREK